MYSRFLSGKWLFCYHLTQKEGADMYDNDEMMMNILDDDLFPLEKESDTEDSD